MINQYINRKFIKHGSVKLVKEKYYGVLLQEIGLLLI